MHGGGTSACFGLWRLSVTERVVRFYEGPGRWIERCTEQDVCLLDAGGECVLGVDIRFPWRMLGQILWTKKRKRYENIRKTFLRLQVQLRVQA